MHDVVEPQPRRPFVQGGQWVARPTRHSVLAWMLVVAVFAIPLPGLFRGVGSAMEEGFMLVFPERLLKGDLPNRDYLHLYGPGSIHFLAGWFKLFGTSLESQRVVGILQHGFGVAAIFTLCRPWGYRVAATAAATMTILMLIPTGLAALAWPGAVAVGLWSVIFGLRAFHLEGRSRVRALVGAGGLVGLALSLRPDLVIALTLVWAFLWWRHRFSWMPVAGALVGLIPMWVHLAMVGVPTAWQGMVGDPLVRLRPGRSLPRPPSWSNLDGALQALSENPVDAPWWRPPAFSASHQLFFWFFAVIIVNAAVPLAAWWWWRRRGGCEHLMVLAAAGLFGLGLTGQALQRPDSTHLAWGCAVGFSLLPALVAEWIRHRPAMHVGVRALAPTAVIAVVLIVVCPFYSYRSYLAAARVSAGNLPGGYEVSRNDRHFYFGNQALQSSAQAAVDLIDSLATPGERLLVGPANLSRTIYSDVVFYHLFPELEPATYFIEMDPGLADLPDSGLAEDVASADWLILTNYWTYWYEPNTSTQFRSTEPNQVVADNFCLVGSFADALVLVYRACAEGDGIDPSTLGIGPDRRAAMEAEKERRGG